jgi:hypothetical protein
MAAIDPKPRHSPPKRSILQAVVLGAEDMMTKQKQAYVYIGTGLLWGAVAIDKTFFHIDRPFAWFTVALAVASLVLGAMRLRAARHAKTSAVHGGFNRSTQRSVRTSQLAFGTSRFFSAAR